MFNFYIKPFAKFMFCLSFTVLPVGNLFTQNVEGYVFVDKNHNLTMDPDEKGLRNVVVSNQKDVVVTDEEGHFQIKLIEGNYIFVTKPVSYQFNLDEFNNPEFYFLYKTKRIKEDLFYSTAQINTDVPELLHFPVYENKGEEAHTCLLVGDPQMKNKEELNFYKKSILPLMVDRNADFYIILGDIAYNNLDILPLEKQSSAILGIPGYRAFGNHDMNYRASENSYASETFKAVFGPDYYSFDYGKFHYVILNNIVYEGWQKEHHAFGEYSGGLSPKQKKWLVNDLKHVSSEKTIVLLSHIPLHKNFLPQNDMKTLFKTLAPYQKILAVSGHLHSIVAYDYMEKSGWESDGAFEGLVVGAASGSWWSGPMDANNIPIATCTDGSPKGFFQLNTKYENYNYVFYAADPIKMQMKIYINADEVLVNWFTGKRTDTVWMQIDDDPNLLKLQNFIGKDPLVELNSSSEKLNSHLAEASETSHFWKAKLPKGLKPGNHKLKLIAKDSKGEIFEGLNTFKIEKE